MTVDLDQYLPGFGQPNVMRPAVDRKALFAAEVKDWSEEDHPRDPDGRFASGDTSAAAAPGEKIDASSRANLNGREGQHLTVTVPNTDGSKLIATGKLAPVGAHPNEVTLVGARTIRQNADGMQTGTADYGDDWAVYATPRLDVTTGYTIPRSSAAGYTADDLRPYIGQRVRVVTGGTPVRTWTGTLTGVNAKAATAVGPTVSVTFGPDGHFTAGSNDVDRRDGAENVDGRYGPVTVTAERYAEPVTTVAPDLREYTGVHPEVDQAVRDARAIMLRQGPATPDEKEVQARLYARLNYGNEMNSSLAGAYEQAVSGKTPQQYAADRFAEWFRSESASRPGMVAYGGDKYAEKLIAAMGRAKPDPVEGLKLDGRGWPKPERGTAQESMRQEAENYLYSFGRNAKDADLAKASVAYLEDLYGAVAKGDPPPAVPEKLAADLADYRVMSVAARHADPNGGNPAMFGPEHIAAIAARGIPASVQSTMVSGRAILTERAFRNVGDKVDAAVEAKNPGLGAKEDAYRKKAASDIDLRAKVSRARDDGRKTMAALGKDIANISRERDGVNVGPDEKQRLAARLSYQPCMGVERARALVEANVGPGPGRDHILGLVDKYGAKLDRAKDQEDKNLKALLGGKDLSTVLFSGGGPGPLIAERRAATLDVLGQVRPVGHDVNPYDADADTDRLPGGGPKMVGAGSIRSLLIDATRRFPTDWLATTGKVIGATSKGYLSVGEEASRGYWQEATNTLMVSARRSPVDGDPQGLPVAVHELGHMMESVHPELAAASAAHIADRTAGEKPQRLAALTGVRAYDDREVARPDGFVSPYIGKDYRGAGTELMSMGLESVLVGTHGGLTGVGADDSARPDVAPGDSQYRPDPETRRYVLGALATV